MKFRLDSFNAYVINKVEGGYFLSNGNGFVIESEQAIEIGKGLIEFAKKHSKELEKYNINRNIELQKEINSYWKEMNEKTMKKVDKSGYIYLFECGGRYKVGYSKNPDRRLKELDKRPFKLNIIARSKKLDKAYDLEQELHQKLEKYRINGEWYEFSDDFVERIETLIKNLDTKDE